MSLVRFRAFDISTSEGRSRERYRRAALTTVASGAARGISLLTSLVSVPLTYNYLGAERYGIWMVLTSIIAFMSFGDLGIGNGLVNSLAEAHGKGDRNLAREYFTSALSMMATIAAAFALIGVLSYSFLPWLRIFNTHSISAATEGSRAFVVLYAWFVVNIPLGIVGRAQSGLQQGYTSQIVGAIGNLLSLLAILVAIAMRGNLPWLVFASTCGVVLAALVNGVILFRQHPWLLPSLHFYRKSAARKILKLGGLFFLLQISGAVGYTSDNIVIAQVLGATAVAAYAVPQKLFSSVSLLINMAITPLWPAYGEAIARRDYAWVSRAFLHSLRIVLIVCVPLCSLLVLGGPWILRVAVGKSLHASFALLVVLGLWSIVASISTTIATLLNGIGVIKEQTLITVAVSLANLALSIYLTRQMGVIGVCLGSLLSQALIGFPAAFFIVRHAFRTLETRAGVGCAGPAGA